MSAPPFASLNDLMAGWADDVLTGKPPPRWPSGPGPLARFPLGPGLACLIGGPPGAGKTALANQLAFDAARLNPDLRVLVTCCEVPTAVLLDRQLSRLTGIAYSDIRDRVLAPAQHPLVKQGMATLAAVGDRVGFLTGPFTLAAVAEAADAGGADLIVLDYLQRLSAADAGGRAYRDRRSMTTAVLDALRSFAAAGRGLLALSSVNRQPGKNGKSNYDDLSLASFKESGDIEYMADDAYILPPAAGGSTTLRHVKARHTEPADIRLRVDLGVMRFDPAASEPPAAASPDPLAAARSRWAAGGAKGGAA